MTHKRVTERRVQEGEFAIIAAQIAGKQRQGVLAGVTVDFRHGDLPPSDWEPLPQWFVLGNSGIVFPDEVNAISTTTGPERDILDEMVAQSVKLRPGDRLTIESVIPEIGDGRFDHPHDRQCRRAYLRVERPSGEVLGGIGPLAFYGVTRIRNGAHRESFDHVLGRICLHSGKDLYERGINGTYAGPWDWGMPLEEIARRMGTHAHDSYFRLFAQLPPEGTARALLRSLVNDAAVAGFLVGKIEARKAEKIGAGALRGVEAGAAATRNEAWREGAKHLWAEHPGWTLYAVANAIKADSDDSQNSIERAIAHLCPPSSPSYTNARCKKARERLK